MNLTAILPLLSLTLGTFYVSPIGNDSTGDGSNGNPWRTLTPWTPAANDIMIEKQGNYTNASYLNINVTNVTIKAETPRTVTNVFGLVVSSSGDHLTVDGIDWQKGDNTGAYYGGSVTCFLLKGADYFTFTNCVGLNGWFIHSEDPGSFGNPSIAASYANIINNVFKNQTNDTFITMQGTNNVVQGNYIMNGYSADAFRGFGGLTIRGNFITNITEMEGIGNHPDIFQTFGDYGWGCKLIFEQNTVVNCPVQLCQLEANAVTNTDPNAMAGYNLIFRNNIITNCIAQGSIDVPNVKFYNDLFYRCNFGSANGLSYAYFDPAFPYSSNPNNRGQAIGGEVYNCAFIECQTQNQIGFGISAVTWDGSNWVTWTGYDTNIVKVLSDNNYFTWTSWAAKTITVAPHSINGGDPGFIPGTFKPMAGSFLINAGTVITNVSNDIDGISRPLGGSYDIGPYEYDPSLKMHLSFNDNFPSQGYTLDLTGNNHKGWINMNPTNQVTIAATNGAFASAAAHFVTNGYSTNGGSIYEISQYIAVTNAGMNLTNGSISFWVKFNHKAGAAPATGQRLVYLFDSGNKLYTNIFHIGRLQLPNETRITWRVYQASTIDSDGDLILYSPTNAVSDVDESTPLTHYTLTWNCSSNISSMFVNGVLWQTNTTLNIPYFRIGGSSTNDWLAIGANAHDGTYNWGDDIFPNDAYLNGDLDEIAIWDRELSSNEVSALYVGKSAAVFSDNPIIIPPVTTRKQIEGNFSLNGNFSIQ